MTYQPSERGISVREAVSARTPKHKETTDHVGPQARLVGGRCTSSACHAAGSCSQSVLPHRAPIRNHACQWSLLRSHAVGNHCSLCLRHFWIQ